MLYDTKAPGAACSRPAEREHNTDVTQDSPTCNMGKSVTKRKGRTCYRSCKLASCPAHTRRIHHPNTGGNYQKYCAVPRCYNSVVFRERFGEREEPKETLRRPVGYWLYISSSGAFILSSSKSIAKLKASTLCLEERQTNTPFDRGITPNGK